MDFSIDRSFEVRVIDILNDQALFRRYFLEIPVIRLDGRDVFTAEDLALQSDCERNLKDLVTSLD